MELKKYKKFYSFLIIGLIVFSTINSFYQPEEISNELPEETSKELTKEKFEINSAYVGSLDVSTIFFEHVKGTIKLKVSCSFKYLEIDNAYDDEFAKSFVMRSLPNVYEVQTGELYSSDHLGLSQFSYHELHDGSYGQVLDGYSEQYITNYGDSDLNKYSPDFTVDKELNYGSSSQTTDSDSASFMLYWNLQPIISLDSDYYNFDNVRYEVYDKIIASWTEFDPTDIILSHPEYKLRIYDKETNNLIFEDSDYQFFKYYREISLDTLKIQNNAPEPVSTSIRENGHYKGAYSFDLEEVNTQPSDFIDTSGNGCLTYISDEIDGHNKVLTLDDQSATDSCSIYREFNYQLNPTIEVWVAKSSLIAVDCSFSFYEGSTRIISLYFSDNNLEGHESDHILQIIDTDFFLNTNTFVHLKLVLNNYTNTYAIYRNEVLLEAAREYYENSTNGISKMLISTRTSHSNFQYHFDAFDFSWSPDYYEGRNLELNTSEDLWSWESFPEWESGYYGVDENLDDWVNSGNDVCEIVSEIEDHKNVIHVEGDVNDKISKPYNTAQSSGDVEIFIYKITSSRLEFRIWNTELFIDQFVCRVAFGNDLKIDFEGTTNDADIQNYILNTWIHIRIVWERDSTCTLYIDGIDISTRTGKDYDSRHFMLYNRYNDGQKYYIDGLGIDSDGSLPFSYANTLENTTTSPLPMETNYSTQVNPYSSVQTNYTVSNYLVGITDLYDNVLETQGLSNSSEDNEIIYTPPNVRTCLISLSDQRSNYLDWQNYRIKIDGSSIYEQYFYREIAEIVNISIYDRFDQYLTSEIYTVERDDNFINIQLTLHSLKIFNQQELFNFVNVTRDPNYYDTSEYWSEWLAPNEIAEFRLSEGHYKIEIQSNENSTNLEYGYYLTCDDILLLTSANTITNTILSILNVNSTLGNQITNVEINITNQNSEINSSIINIDINLENINSTLGDQLINLDTAITNLNSDVDTLFLFTNNSLINLNSSLDSLFLNVETNILSINDSISTLIIDINNDIALLNASIDTQFTQISNELILMESNLNASIFNIDTNIDLLGNNITENYILLNNSLNLIDNNINESNIAILNYLTLVNNSIMESIQNMLTQVYLINNSIYSAVVNMGTSLSIDNNEILGNLTIILQLNEELTDLFVNTMFSEYLDWTNATIDSDHIMDQTEYVDILNKYNNESLEILFKYQDEIESLVIASQDTLSQLIPNQNVTYRVKSLETGEFLDDWKPIPENQTIDLGFYSEPVSITPEDIKIEMKDYLTLAMIAVIALTVIALMLIKKSKELENVPRTLRKPKKSNPNFRGKNDMDIFRP